MEHDKSTVLYIDGRPLLRCNEYADRPGSALVVLVGELDCSGNDTVDGALDRMWTAWPEAATVDLRQLTFINAAGLSSLLVAQRTARVRGVWLSLRCRPGLVARSVERIGLTQQQELEVPGPVRVPVLTEA